MSRRRWASLRDKAHRARLWACRWWPFAWIKIDDVTIGLIKQAASLSGLSERQVVRIAVLRHAGRPDDVASSRRRRWRRRR